MLTRAGIMVALLVAPSLAFAAFDTVQLTTAAVLSVNGITLNVSGSTANISSITVNPTNFVVSLDAGSNFQVTAPGLNQLSVDTSSGMIGNTCNGSSSLVSYAPSQGVTVTITPSATLCTTSTSGGGGGTTGGGGGSTTTTTSTTPTTTTTTVTPTTTTVTTPTPTTTATPASGLSSEQVTSILNVLTSFGADNATIANVQAALMGTGGTTTGSATSAAVHIFKSDLTTNSLGSEVKALQTFLNAHGYTVSASGPGSSGNETTKFGPATKAALIKYQKAKGITPAAGFFGAKTRAAVNSGS